MCLHWYDGTLLFQVIEQDFSCSTEPCHVVTRRLTGFFINSRTLLNNNYLWPPPSNTNTYLAY